MGIRLVEIDVDDDTYLPRIEDVERAITPQHGRPRVLGAGRQLRRPRPGRGVRGPRPADGPVPPRRRRVRRVHPAVHARPRLRRSRRSTCRSPGVSSIMTDGHKLGLLPIATGFFLVKDASRARGDPDRADADPHDLVDEAGQPGGGRVGDVPSTSAARATCARRRTSSGCADIIAEGVTAIPGMALAAPRFISIVGFTSTSIDLEVVHRLLAEDGWGQGYGVTRGKPFIRLSIHPSRDDRGTRTGSWRRSRTPSPGPDAPDAADAMLRLLGYTDRLSAAPGDTIRFMVSSDHDRYESRLVRLIHGDTNPAGPGFKQVLVPSAIDGDAGGAHQDLPSGSFATVPVPAGIARRRLHVRGLRPADGAGRARAGHREPRRPVRWRRLGAGGLGGRDARGGHRAWRRPGRGSRPGSRCRAGAGASSR